MLIEASWFDDGTFPDWWWKLAYRFAAESKADEEIIVSFACIEEEAPLSRSLMREPVLEGITPGYSLFSPSLSCSFAGCDPPRQHAGERIKEEAYDLFAVRLVSEALRHHRIEFVLPHYLS